MAETNGHNGTPPAVTPPGGNGNGSANGGGGVVSKVLAGAKSVQARATEEIKETIKAPEKTDVWKSVLRVRRCLLRPG